MRAAPIARSRPSPAAAMPLAGRMAPPTRFSGRAPGWDLARVPVHPPPATREPVLTLRRQEAPATTGADVTPAAAAPSAAAPSEPGNVPGCTPRPGLTPSLGNCAAYAANAWWLPDAYVVNATCACLATPNSPSANCVRQTLQTRMAATPTALKLAAAAAKGTAWLDPSGYQLFVQTALTPRIYADHVAAYAGCCCPSGPAPYPAWIGVTTVPIPVCDIVGLTIRWFGSCHGTPGAW